MDKEYYQLIIVDDEEQARRSLSKYLDWHQLDFHVAATLEDGSDAIDYIKGHPVDAILTDIQMFEVSGLELARWVQANHSETRVVILSGYDEIEYVHAAIQSDAVDFLVKPVLKDALIRAFEKVRKKLDEERAGRYSLQYMASQLAEEKENDLATIVADGECSDLEEAWHGWTTVLGDASEATVSSLTVRLMKHIYQCLEKAGALLPEECGWEATYHKLDAMQGHPDTAAIYALLRDVARQRSSQTDQEDLPLRTKQWIAAHLSEDFSLEDVCAALYVSKGHLCREFKKATNETVMSYVEQQRMEKAAALLQQHRYSYAQLSTMVGYNDSHYFSKVFHKYMERHPDRTAERKKKP